MPEQHSKIYFFYFEVFLLLFFLILKASEPLKPLPGYKRLNSCYWKLKSDCGYFYTLSVTKADVYFESLKRGIVQ